MRTPSPRSLSEMLYADDSNERKSALTALLVHPELTPSFVQEVEENLIHPDPEVRSIAFAATDLQERIEPNAFAKVIAANLTPGEVIRAIYAMQRAHADDFVSADHELDPISTVVATLGHEDANVRDAAGWTLPNLGRAAIKPVARRFHRGDSRDEVIAAACTLARFGEDAEEIEPVVWNRTRDADCRIRLASLAAWIRVTGRTTRSWRDQLKPFRAALLSESPDDRDFALRMIAELRCHGRPLASDVSRCASVHPEALRTLVAIDADPAEKLAASERALRSTDPHCAHSAALVLSTIPVDFERAQVDRLLEEICQRPAGDHPQAAGVAQAARKLRGRAQVEEENHADPSRIARQAS